MKLKLNKISLYWKCQLTGWFLLALISTFYRALAYNRLFKQEPLIFILPNIRDMIIGIFITHIMRWVIKKNRILEKQFLQQAVFLILLTVVFSILEILIGNLVTGMRLSSMLIHNIKGMKAKEILFTILTLTSATILIWNLIYFMFHYFIKLKKAETSKFEIEKELLELEAKALHAQMNPHFIFNCMNSIKSLIQQHEEEKSINYLTTFSKLIRTLFNNADKKEISLFDEIETCRYYLQLESMRFDSKFSYQINIDDSVDLKSVFVPALIVQPFIENAIWHGIVPRNNGGKVILSVSKQQSGIEIIVDDDGIGREYSKQNKSVSALTHQSKGVNLTEARLHLNNLLQQRQAELEIIDKKDATGSATGTTVIIKIKEELS